MTIMNKSTLLFNKYKDGTMNDFVDIIVVDIIVVDFPPEYAIQFMKEIEYHSNYSDK